MDDQEEREAEPRVQFRHLPPRITPEQMIEMQPIVRAIADDQRWTADEREIQRGVAG